MSIKFLVLGGGVFWIWGGGGGVPILFLWARGFSDNAETHCNSESQIAAGYSVFMERMP